MNFAKSRYLFIVPSCANAQLLKVEEVKATSPYTRWILTTIQVLNSSGRSKVGSKCVFGGYSCACAIRSTIVIPSRSHRPCSCIYRVSIIVKCWEKKRSGTSSSTRSTLSSSSLLLDHCRLWANSGARRKRSGVRVSTETSSATKSRHRRGGDVI